MTRDPGRPRAARAVVAVVAATCALAPAPLRSQAPVGSGLVEEALAPWTGDLAGMVERGTIRVLTAFSRTHFYLDGGEMRGLTHALMQEFESFANARLEPDVEIVMVPAPRALLLDWLLAGRGDVVAANLTVTSERGERVAFTAPLIEDAVEQVVLGPKVAAVDSLDAVAAQGIALHLRAESSYFEHVRALNAERTDPIPVVVVDPALTDEDLLDMVAAGLAPATVVDRHKLDLWGEVYPELVVPEGLTVAEGRTIALAVRPANAELKALLDAFVPTVERGSLIGNILIERYLQDVDRLSDPGAAAARARFEEMRSSFEAAGERFDIDWTLLAALAFKESRLDQAARSDRGAVGVMQILPSTAREPYVDLPEISRLEVNITAGAKYLRWLIDTWFDDPAIAPSERALFALAAYNAGPGNIEKARRQAEALGLDPNRWFDHVELATARTVGRGPVTYVRDVYKYYVTYRRLLGADAGG
jgi:membrane-bound lytic murein transglycosylase MltF